MPSAITCTCLSFAWPDGTVVASELTAAFSPGRTGLIGVNGSGKSTLLRLIAGELTPTAGSVSVAGRAGYLPQDLTLDAAWTSRPTTWIATRGRSCGTPWPPGRG